MMYFFPVATIEPVPMTLVRVCLAFLTPHPLSSINDNYTFKQDADDDVGWDDGLDFDEDDGYGGLEEEEEASIKAAPKRKRALAPAPASAPAPRPHAKAGAGATATKVARPAAKPKLKPKAKAGDSVRARLLKAMMNKKR
jgi:hypothetical protein